MSTPATQRCVDIFIMFQAFLLLLLLWFVVQQQIYISQHEYD